MGTQRVAGCVKWVHGQSLNIIEAKWTNQTMRLGYSVMVVTNQLIAEHIQRAGLTFASGASKYIIGFFDTGYK